jgi:4-amino-4-deoxy-L-arabinose transferase-like glycosyltransferase
LDRTPGHFSSPKRLVALRWLTGCLSWTSLVDCHRGGCILLRALRQRHALTIAVMPRMKLNASQYWTYGLLLMVILFFALIRFHLRECPLERDEGEYAYAGQLMLQGIPPYQLVYSMKLPGTFMAYSVILALFGQTPSGIHLGLLLVNAATTLLIFLLARRLFGPFAGLVAAASYALLSTSPSLLGFAGHATHFVVLPAVGGILLLLMAIDSRRLWLFFGSGVLLGLAFLMKQPGILFAVFGGLYLVKSEYRDGRLQWCGLMPKGPWCWGQACLSP